MIPVENSQSRPLVVMPMVSEAGKKAEWRDGVRTGATLKDSKGRDLFACKALVLLEGRVVPVGLTVAVDPGEMKLMHHYKAVGVALLTPYVRNGDLCFSLACDAIEPLRTNAQRVSPA